MGVIASISLALLLLLLLTHPLHAFVVPRENGHSSHRQCIIKAIKAPSTSLRAFARSNTKTNTNFGYDSKATDGASPNANTFAPSWELSDQDPNFKLETTTTTTTRNNATASSKKDAPPLYITIGPPCGGKTAALRATLEYDGYDSDTVFDVALDEASDTADHPLFVRIPLAVFLFPQRYLGTTSDEPQPNDNTTTTSNTTTTAMTALANRVLASGVTVRDRLCDPRAKHEVTADEELRNVLLRVAGRMTAEEFDTAMRRMVRQAGDTVQFFRQRRSEIADDLIVATEQVSVQAVGEVLFQREIQAEPVVLIDPQTGQPQEETQEELPYNSHSGQAEDEETSTTNSTTTIANTTTTLLSARALIQTPHVQLFVPHAMFGGGGIQEAEEELQEQLAAQPDQPIAWGNTNTRPLEYVAALKAAERAQRRVHFVAWGCLLPRVSRIELLRRNMARFRRTGRYIPSGALGASLDRVERLVQRAQQKAMPQQWKDDGDADDFTNDGDGYANGTDVNEEMINHGNDDDDNTRPPDRHAMDHAFASLAGFHMDDDGYVVQVGEPVDLNPPKQTSRRNKRSKATRNGRPI